MKTILDIVIHGYQVRETYGCGLALLGAIWDSVTHLLMYIKGKRNVENQTQPQGISITSNDTIYQQPTHTTSALNELKDTISQISSGNLISKRGGVTSHDPHVPERKHR